MKKIAIVVSVMLSVISFGRFAQEGHHRHHHVISTAPLSSIDINKATASELVTLKGIGEKKAEAIVNYRNAHGAFKTLDDLNAVKGISAKMIARIEAKNPGKLKVS